MTQTKKQSLLLEMIKYGAVGAISTIIDYLLLNFSYYLLGNQASLLWLSTGIGFTGGMINGYFLNSRWTFAYNTRGKEATKLSQFAIVSLIGLGLTELIVLNFSLKFGLEKNVSKLISVVIVFFWNYFANKFWTFKK